MKKRPSIGVALSGGMGYTQAHIGVLRTLVEAGVSIDYVAGTSGGAIIGAFYAAGLSFDDMVAAASRMRWRNLTRFDFSLMGLFSSLEIQRQIENIIGSCRFEELMVPFAAVATELLSGTKYVFRTGSVPFAVRASCNIAHIYTPIRYNDMLLIDGAYTEKLPVETVRGMGAEVVIGVDVTYRSQRIEQPRNMIQINAMLLSLLAEQNARLSRQRADVMVYPSMRSHSAVELGRLEENIRAGEQAANEALDKIDSIVHHYSRFILKKRWNSLKKAFKEAFS